MNGEYITVETAKRRLKIEQENKKLKKKIEEAIRFIKETTEYYSDGVNEELIQILKGSDKE